MYQWIGLRENLQEIHIFNGNIYGFRSIFSRKNQSIVLMVAKLGFIMLKIIYIYSSNVVYYTYNISI